MQLESNIEDFLGFVSQLVPLSSTEWQGADDDEIEFAEQSSGRTFPRFHRWFLSVMGNSMGVFDVTSVEDLSATGILRYHLGATQVQKPNMLYFGSRTCEVAPIRYYFDLNQAENDDDAPVVSASMTGGEWRCCFESLREKLAWDFMMRLRIFRSPVWLSGKVRGRSIMTSIERSMLYLGFRRSIAQTGECLAIYERDDIALVFSIDPRLRSSHYRYFNVSGKEEAEIRSLLGQLSESESVDVEFD